MKKIDVIARFKVHPGKLDEFKEAAAECLALVKEKDPATLRYEWFLNGDQTECIILETYETSEAMLAHMNNVNEPLGRLMAMGDMSAEVFGDPSPELRQMAAGMSVPIYSFLQGLG